MAKLLFINPVVREEDEPRHVPYGMALLAAIVMRQGHSVQVFDANAWRAPDAVLSQVLTADRWDVIGIGGITTAYRSIKHISAIAKEVAPQALLVAGGGFLTSMPHDIMRFLPQLDVGVVGEAFVSFPEVLRRARAGSTPSSPCSRIWTACRTRRGSSSPWRRCTSRTAWPSSRRRGWWRGAAWTSTPATAAR